MNSIEIIPIESNEKEYNVNRFVKSGRDNNYFRSLTRTEIDILEMQKNRCYDWSTVLVTDNFIPNQIKLCHFSGLVRIGDMDPISLVYHDLTLPVGLYNSHIVSCDIGRNCAVHNVSYMSRYILGEQVILKDINELVTSDRVKFGNGIVRKGEDPKVRIELEIANEAGGREILPFTKMLTPDAYIWYKYRDRKALQKRLVEMVDREYGDNRGEFGSIGDRTIIKNSRILKDVEIGTDAYIKGCNKLKNLTIKSTPKGRTQIGEGCELVNGIIGEGCRIFYGAMAVRFQLMPYSSLKYGARLINSVLGENSTISCCEVLNSFIFPGHEQHHNSSFLIAAILKGQTNIASGATIGSNHNSRKNDGEIVAGRGFWPGLNCSLKHNSKFASFNIVVKGSYNHEINSPLPFSLISLNSDNELQIFPGYWFLYNMYALRRNSWKSVARDKRKSNFPNFEYDFLAPDTVLEMLDGMAYLERVAESSFRKLHPGSDIDGSVLLENYEDYGAFTIKSSDIENSLNDTVIHKPGQAYIEYRKMIDLFIVQALVESNLTLSELVIDDRFLKWVNCGGQQIPEFRVNELISEIEEGIIENWDEVHAKYGLFSELYFSDRAMLAVAIFNKLYTGSELKECWDDLITNGVSIREEIRNRVHESRLKDYKSKFRKMVYDSEEEMRAVLGDPEAEPFFKTEDKEAREFIEKIKKFNLE